MRVGISYSLFARLHAEGERDHDQFRDRRCVRAGNLSRPGRHQVSRHGDLERRAAVRREVAAAGGSAVHELEHDRHGQRDQQQHRRDRATAALRLRQRLAGRAGRELLQQREVDVPRAAWPGTSPRSATRTAPCACPTTIASGSPWVRSTSSARAARWISATRTCSSVADINQTSSRSSAGRARDHHQQRDRRVRQLGRYHRSPVHLDVLEIAARGGSRRSCASPILTAPGCPPALPSVRKAAVLGAGVMGAQIAAHLVNANVPAVLFELAGQGGRSQRQRARRRSTT